MMSLGLAACDNTILILDQLKGEASHTGSDGGAAPGCIDLVQGSETSCKDVGTWKQYASQSCEQSGLALSDYLPKDACGPDSFRSVGYTCCPKVAPPPPPPPPSTCVTGAQGGDTSCKDAGAWKMEAGQACSDLGLSLRAYTPEKECGKDNYQSVSFTCC